MESHELHDADAFAEMMQATLTDALARLSTTQATPVALADCAVISFRQTWPDANCGSGGLAAHVLTDAQTVVTHWPAGDMAVVHIRGEHAYTLRGPTARFWEALGARRLPGAAEPHDDLGEPI